MPDIFAMSVGWVAAEMVTQWYNLRGVGNSAFRGWDGWGKSVASAVPLWGNYTMPNRYLAGDTYVPKT